jgi:hypothetical protein
MSPSKIVYKDLKQYSREELKEIVREQQDEIESQKHTVLLFDDENKILKIKYYDSVHELEIAKDSRDEVKKELHIIYNRLEKIKSVLSDESLNCVEIIQELQEALGVSV